MRKIILMGKTGCGKTTLTQALKGEEISYYKTQYINNYSAVIDTPGEYAENKILGRALGLYSYEADVVGLIVSSVDEEMVFPPNIVSMANREVIGIITQIDQRKGNINRARLWLSIAGCTKIFEVCAKTGRGVAEILDFLNK